MQINDFLGIAIVGVIISFLVEVIKARYSTKPNTSKALTIGLALGLGISYAVIRETPYYQPVLGALAASSAVWALILRSTE